jgi:superfamily II DNA or RNA helicase
MPTGSGKTLLSGAIIEESLSLDPTIRTTIIATPQTIIAQGYKAQHFLRPRDNQPVDLVPIDLASTPQSDDSKSQFLRDFLGLNHPLCTLAGRVIVCTSATLARAFHDCTTSDRHLLFRNLLIIFDEAHHLWYESDDLKNRLGSVIEFACKSETIHVGLMTATFRRGNMAAILPDELFTKFTKFKFGYPDYFACVRPFEKFTYNFVPYDGLYRDALTLFFQEPEDRDRKTFLYVPPVNSAYSVGSKRLDWLECYKAISGGDDAPRIEDEDKPVIRIWNRHWKTWVKVLNLVDDDTSREARKAEVHRSHSGDGSEIDVIIALNMLKEGANWGWGDRMLIIGPRNSSTDHEQTIGRLFRKPGGEKGQKHAKNADVYHLFSRGLHEVNDAKKDMKLQCNRYLNGFLMAMLLDVKFRPVEIRAKRLRKPGGDEEAEKPIGLDDIAGGEDAAMLFHGLVFDKFMSWLSKHEHGEAVSDEHRRAALSRIIRKELAKTNRQGFTDEAFKIIWRMWQRATAEFNGIPVTDDMVLDLCTDNPLGFGRALVLEFYDKLESTEITWKTVQKMLCDRLMLSRENYFALEEARQWAREHPELCRTYLLWKRSFRLGLLPPQMPGTPDYYSMYEGWKGRREFLEG